MKTLLLWDIDGTLTSSIGAGIRGLTVALREVFGIEGTLTDIKFGGRTDGWAVQHVFEKYSIPLTAENVARYFDGYIAALPTALTTAEARVLPGVRELLLALKADGRFAHGLLTGNLQRGAKVKLSHHGLWQHFPFGAFGDDSDIRNDLGAFALRRACEHHRCTFTGANTWVIGDTPHDVECGKFIGARTLAVATGMFPIEELRAHQPTAAFANFADTDAVLRVLTRDFSPQ